MWRSPRVPTPPGPLARAWYNQPMRPLTTDMTDASSRPYFIRDEDITVAELHRTLAQGSEYDRHRLLAKMLREARDVDVWHFVTPEAVAETLPSLDRRLG